MKVVTWLLQMIASACSKVVASTATYPHEVVRSHMHISGSASVAGLVEVCKDVSHLHNLTTAHAAVSFALLSYMCFEIRLLT